MGTSKRETEYVLECNELDAYLHTICLLDQITDDYIYLYDLQTNRIYLTEKFHQKYSVPMAGDEGNLLSDFIQIIDIRDREILKWNLRQIHSGVKKEFNAEYRVLDKKGHSVWVNDKGITRCDENGKPIILVGRVTELAFNRMIDRLTGLRNEDKFMVDIEKSLQLCDGYLMLLGVDNFKDINIKHGRSYGDYILRMITEILEKHSEHSLNLYRLTGDCFAINFPQKEQEEVSAFYESLKKELEEYCTISAGVVAYKRNDATDGGAVYQYAENALDRAKREGKNTLVFFSPDDYQRSLERIELQNELKASVQDNCRGFYLCYQPQINCHDFSLYGAEALLRYESQKCGLVGPNEFIPLLEQTGLIRTVGLWVLKTALYQCKEWRKLSPNFHISVNISYVQLRQSGITDMVLNLLKEVGLPGDALTLEVTESMQLQDYIYFNKIFYEWKRYGIKISIDDFGTGYSSLSYLKGIDVDEAKIDRCFVNRIEYNAYNYRLLANIIELAHGAHIRVCCEGVEIEEELAALQELHPDLLQGYLFSKPCTTQEFEQAYIRTDTQEYQARTARAAQFRRMDSYEKQKFFETLKQEEISSIVENLDEVIYVSDVDTYDMYYMNQAGRRLLGIYDYKGCKCYAVIQGRSEPCEFCTNAQLKEDCFHVWKTKNLYLDGQYIIKDRLIPWQGKQARLEIAIDITKKEIERQEEQKKLDFAQAIVQACLASTGESDTET